MKLEEIKLELRSPADLVPYVKNAKIHTPEQIDKIAGQISAFGFDQPIVVDQQNVIIKGHGRREAALKLGLKEVPVIVSSLDEYEAMAARIADNKVVSTEYNVEVLKFDLGTLKNKGMDLKLTGMSALELKPLVLSDTVNREVIGSLPSGDDEYQEPGEVTSISPSEYGENPEGETSGGYFLDRTPVIQYNVVFDDVSQQEKWHAFIGELKSRYPEMETIASRLIHFIETSMEVSL